MKKRLFGAENIRWGIKELIKMYSDQPSFFSKKRIESGIAFILMEFGLMYWFFINAHKMDATELLLWASANALISGYNIQQIQKDKAKNDQKA